MYNELTAIFKTFQNNETEWTSQNAISIKFPYQFKDAENGVDALMLLGLVFAHVDAFQQMSFVHNINIVNLSICSCSDLRGISCQ